MRFRKRLGGPEKLALFSEIGRLWEKPIFKDKMMNLNDIIRAMGDMDYDTLRDFRDRVAYDPYDQRGQHWNYQRGAIKWGRRGRKSIFSITYPNGLEGVAQMPEGEREVIVTTANALIEAKAPVAARRFRADGTPIAKGTWQVKSVTRPVVDRDSGKVHDMMFSYLYLRVLMTAGDNDRSKRRYASIYIGSLNRQDPKPFLAAVQGDVITAEQIIEVFREGGYDAVREWRKDMDAAVE